MRVRALAIVTAMCAALLAGCASESPSAESNSNAPAGNGEQVAFPVTIEHALGKTTIPKKPERIATVAWANHEVPLALGIVPVGMSKATWGDDDGDGVLPWVEERLTELNAQTPVLFDETDGIDFEAVADTRPDVILAAYSGITKEDYATLSKIAPVVAYPKVPWSTSYQDMVRLNSRALGMASEGDKLISDLADKTAASLTAHPKLAGKKILFSYLDPSDLSQIGFYTTNDTRPGFLADLGLPMPSVVTEKSSGSTKFFETVSSEHADKFADVDLFVTYGKTDGSTLKQLQADPLLAKIPAIASGHVAVLEDSTPLAAAANPTPLSITWGIDDYLDLLAQPLN